MRRLRSREGCSGKGVQGLFRLLLHLSLGVNLDYHVCDGGGKPAWKQVTYPLDEDITE